MAAFFVGALVLVNQGLALDARLGLLPIFYHLLMVGLAALHDPLAAAIGETMVMHLMLVGAGLLYIVAIAAFAAYAAPRSCRFARCPGRIVLHPARLMTPESTGRSTTTWLCPRGLQ